MILAHGGTAGLAAELAVLVVPILVILLVAWWGRRRTTFEEGEADRKERGGNEHSLHAPQEAGEGGRDRRAHPDAS